MKKTKKTNLANRMVLIGVIAILAGALAHNIYTSRKYKKLGKEINAVGIKLKSLNHKNKLELEILRKKIKTLHIELDELGISSDIANGHKILMHYETKIDKKETNSFARIAKSHIMQPSEKDQKESMVLYHLMEASKKLLEAEKLLGKEAIEFRNCLLKIRSAEVSLFEAKKIDSSVVHIANTEKNLIELRGRLKSSWTKSLGRVVDFSVID